MVVSPRQIWAIGLSLAGVIYLAVPSLGQGPKTDRGVQPANGNANAGRSPGTPTAATPTVVGTLDLDYVMKNYDKVKVAWKELGTTVQLRKGELMKIENEARQEFEMLQKLQAGSEDYRKRENKITELKAKMEAGREQVEREITLRQAETLSTLYKEIQTYAQWVAKRRGITHVLTTSNTPPSGSEPNSVIAAMNRAVIYADPHNDITNDVVFYLNQTYQKMGKPAEKPAAARQPQAGGAGGAGAAGAANTGDQ